MPVQQRIPTGVPGLDELMYGGLLEGDAVLVAGAPGSGKSTLGMQFLYEGIMRYDEPGFFITFEEFPQQIYRDAMNFGWDFRALEEEDKLKVLFTSPDLMYQDIKRHEGIFPEMIREIGARRVVVDSLTHFQRLASDAGEMREIIYSLINALKREGLTPLLLRELVEGEVSGTVAEEFTADVVMSLSMERINGQRMRFIEVLKSRGSRHVPAKSLFYFGENGIEIVPPFQEAHFRYQEAISTGVPELDALMGGGIPYGSFYLFEVTSELHQEIFEMNLLRETFTAQEHFFELATTSTWAEKLKQQTMSYGMLDAYTRACESGAVRILNVNADVEESIQPLGAIEGIDDWEEAPQDPGERAVAQLEEAFQGTNRLHRGRLFLDMTRLLTAMDEQHFFNMLLPVLEMIQNYSGVGVGFLNPDAVPASAREKLRSEADGIIRIWTDGNYHYLQVVKTLNAVRTLVHGFAETNSAPYLRILQQ
jgi:circadian clock protein KaiC